MYKMVAHSSTWRLGPHFWPLCAKLATSRVVGGIMDTTARIEELMAEVRSAANCGLRGTQRSVAWQAPLLHRTTSPREIAAVVATDDGQLVPGTGARVRTELGTVGSVFFWVARCSYPETDMILVWAPGFESSVLGGDADGDRPLAFAAPWDTGGLLSKPFGYSLSLAQARTLLERYSLPLPDYRSYLAAVLEACFVDAEKYFRGVPPGPGYPGWCAGTRRNSGPPSYTFEVRHHGAVRLHPFLAAVVVDTEAFANAPRLLRALRRRVNSVGAVVVEPRHGEKAQDAAHRYVRRFLRERGVNGWSP